MFTDAELSRHRVLFPICAEFNYLDHAAVAPCSTLVRAAVDEWMAEHSRFGLHDNVDWEARVDAARDNIAGLIGGHADEIAFVRSTSQGIAMVAEGLPWEPGDEVLVAPHVEYPANVYPWKHLERRGVHLRALPASLGTVGVEEVKRALNAKTRVVAVSSVQFANGCLTDVAAIARVTRDHGATFVLDGIQSVGAVPLDVERDDIPVVSVDSHKWLLGIIGIGFARIERSLIPTLTPSIVGWRSTNDPWAFDGTRFSLRQDASRFEEGSLPYPLIAGLDAAVTLIRNIGVERTWTHIRGLLSLLEGLLDPELFEISPSATARGPFAFIVPRRAEIDSVHRALLTRGHRLSMRRGRLRVAPHLYTRPDDIRSFASDLAAVSAP